MSRAPLSIVLISHSYPPLIGGSELEAQRVSSALIRRGYRVRVVCAGGAPMPPLRDWVDPAGVPVRIYAGRWKGALKDWVFALRVAAMLFWERRNYQVVYFLMQGLHLAAGLPVARFLGKPIVMKIGGSGVVPLMEKSRAGRLELNWLRKWAYRVMILNDGMREEGLRWGFPNEQLHWMPNPVDTDEFAPCGQERRLELRARFALPADAPVVLYLGRLAPEKSLPSLLEAFARLLDRIPCAVLALAGDGPERSALEKKAKDLRLDPGRVRFIGQVNPTEVHLWYQAADVYTLVSWSEGFSCALVEAMSSGLASMVSDIPANRQLIEDGVHGLLASPGDAGAIAAGLVRLLEDAPMRARMAEAARRRVLDNYSLDKIADRYELLLHDAVNSVRGGR